MRWLFRGDVDCGCLELDDGDDIFPDLPPDPSGHQVPCNMVYNFQFVFREYGGSLRSHHFALW